MNETSKMHLRCPDAWEGRRRGILVASKEGGRRGNDARDLQSGREWKSHRRTRTSTLAERGHTRNSTRTSAKTRSTSRRRRRTASRLLPLLLLPAIVPAAGSRQESSRVLSYADEYPSCTGVIQFYSDGDCDLYNNNASCGWDGGDCCECTCVDTLSYTCGEAADGGYYCLDPDSGCQQDSTSAPTATPSSERPLPVLLCPGNPDFVGDGFCDLENNNQVCDYDGGDCCSCTCSIGPRFSCDGPFDCQDPDAACSTAAVGYLWVAWVMLLLGIALVLFAAYSCCDCCFCACERTAEGRVVVLGGESHENVTREDNPENPLPPAQ